MNNMNNNKNSPQENTPTGPAYIPMQDMSQQAYNASYQTPQQGYPMMGNQQQNFYYMNNAHYVPPQQVMMMPVLNGLQKLSQCEGISLKQEAQLGELLHGCEIENRYGVFPTDRFGNQIGTKPMFVCKEKSNWLVRNCMSGSSRPLSINVTNQNGTVINGQIEDTQFLRLEKPFKCTFLCFNRPELVINFVENGDQICYGKIVQPYFAADKGCYIEDQYGNPKFLIEASCCQMPFICALPFQSCQECTFEVKLPTGDVIATIQKKFSGCLRSCNEADNFLLIFPQDLTVEEKTSLMCAILFLDYMYFEQKSKSPPQ